MAAARTSTKTRKTTAKSGARTISGQRATNGRKAPAKKRKPPTRATRSLVASRPGLRSVRDLEPHQIDVLALAVIAVGIFLAGVAYGFWAGGSLGHGVMSGLELLVGKLAYLTPVALVLGGMRVLARDLDVAPATRPLRSGTICLLLALALAFAAGVFGPGQSPSHGFWSGAVMKPRGGLLGGAEYYVTGHLISSAGADILSVFLLLAGVILLSGATFASVINNSRRHASALRRGPEVRSATRRAEIRAARMRRSEIDEDEAMVVPDPGETELIVRATHVEAPPVDVYEDADGQRSFGVTDDDEDEDDTFAPVEPVEFEDFVPLNGGHGETQEMDAVDYEQDDEPVEAAETVAGPARGRPERADARRALPRVGDRRSRFCLAGAVVAQPRALDRRGRQARHHRAGGDRQGARRGAQHFGIEAKVVGQVSGPHITRYEIKLAPAHVYSVRPDDRAQARELVATPGVAHARGCRALRGGTRPRASRRAGRAVERRRLVRLSVLAG